MELSYFYWVWLRESNFGNLLGRKIRFSFSKELIYNPKRSSLDIYFLRFDKFLDRTKRMGRKFLIFHEDNYKLRERAVSLVRARWGNVKVDLVSIDNQRRIGPRGGTEYLVIRSYT
ncbi:MAG: hypothetical protein QXS75_01180, partial [Thermoplasmatales archaeon]